MAAISSKSRLATTLLAWFLGEFGAHRFYLGKIGTAVTMLVLGIIGVATCWVIVGFFFLGAVWIWALIDFIYAVAGLMKDKQGKLIKKW
jgi:TM2 domain-containing membrane protein YozV